MRKTLYDTKKLAEITLGQLMDKVNLFAPQRVKVLAAKAAMDKRISEFTAKEQIKFDADFGPLKTDTDAEEQDIAQIIMAHTEWFIKPRSIKTGNAEFGLRKSPDSAKIKDEAAVIKWADEHKIKLYENNPKIDKDAVLAELKKKTEIPGAELSGGERAFITVKTDNLDAEAKGTL